MKLILGLCLFALATACSISQPPSPTPDQGLSISYLFATETTFVNIEVNHGLLRYTHFVDVHNRCAQWIAQEPCWTEEDLRTEETALPQSDAQSLQALIEETHFMELSISNRAPDVQRYYPYSLQVTLGAKTNEVIYQSYPDAPPMPEAMEKIITRLQELAAQRQQGQR